MAPPPADPVEPEPVGPSGPPDAPVATESPTQPVDADAEAKESEEAAGRLHNMLTWQSSALRLFVGLLVGLEMFGLVASSCQGPPNGGNARGTM